MYVCNVFTQFITQNILQLEIVVFNNKNILCFHIKASDAAVLTYVKYHHVNLRRTHWTQLLEVLTTSSIQSSKLPMISEGFSVSSGGHFKNTYELLYLRAVTFSLVNEIHIFQCMGKIVCVEFIRVPLKFHTKYLIHTWKTCFLYNTEILRPLRFKSSYTFLKHHRCISNRKFKKLMRLNLYKCLLKSNPTSVLRADSRFAPGQWEIALLCNDIFHWLDATLE